MRPVASPGARSGARPGLPATSTPLPLEQPKAGSSPQIITPPNAPSNSAVNQGASSDLKTAPAEARPAALPSPQKAQHLPVKALPKTLRASKPQRPVLSAPMLRAAVYPAQKPLGQKPASVSDAKANASASANIAQPGMPASNGTRGAGMPSSAGASANAPALSTPALTAIGNGLTAKGSRSGSGYKVASVGLPGVESGVVRPKMPVAPVSAINEVVPRPAEKLENCGDDKVFVACPKLKNRYETPYTSEDR